MAIVLADCSLSLLLLRISPGNRERRGNPSPLWGGDGGGGRKVRADWPETGPIRFYKSSLVQSFAPHPHTLPHEGEGRSQGDRRSAKKSARGEGHVVAARDDQPYQPAIGSTPHHSATNSAMVPVMRFSEARLTRSSKAWMFSEIGP